MFGQDRNWLNLTKNVKNLSEEEKLNHIKSIMKIRKQKVNENKTQFMRLTFRLRILCIIKAYFPEGIPEYEKDLQGDMQIDDAIMTNEERRILSGYQLALRNIVTFKDTTKFDVVDKIFGNYRYKKWMEAQNL